MLEFIAKAFVYWFILIPVFVFLENFLAGCWMVIDGIANTEVRPETEKRIREHMAKVKL